MFIRFVFFYNFILLCFYIKLKSVRTLWYVMASIEGCYYVGIVVREAGGLAYLEVNACSDSGLQYMLG
jgi:hypothetical protein